MISKNTIAVLPFKDLSLDSQQEFLCDGITEEIISALSKIHGLKVIARSSSFRFKNKNIDPRIIGNQLKVAFIIEGSIRFSKDKIRVSASMVDAQNGFSYWAKKFDKPMSDIFELEDEISIAIANELRNNFTHFNIQDHLIEKPTDSIAAYKLYLKGRSNQLKWTPEGLKQAIEDYDMAIALDPNFAKPYYGNLQSYGLLAMWGYMNQEEAIEKAVTNLLIAKEINNKLPEYPLSFVGKAFWKEWDFQMAEHHIQQVLKLDPNHIDGLEAAAELYMALGYGKEAHFFAKKLIELDPLSANHHYTQAHIYYYQNDYEKALAAVNYALYLNPELEVAHHLQSFCFIWLKQRENLLLHSENKTHKEEKLMLFDCIHSDDFSLSEQKIEQWQLNYLEAWIEPYPIYILANSGQVELALKWLLELIQQKRGQVINFRQDPFLTTLGKFEAFEQISRVDFEKIININSSEVKEPLDILSNDQKKILREQLISFFEEEQPYLDPQLTLKDVAEVLEVNTNKTSFLINECFGKNFNDFINTYRLARFKEIALNPKNAHITLLGLAYDSGFNSKSVFNTFFKKVEGCTPSKWIKKNMN